MFNQEWQNLRLLFKYSIKRATKTINQPLLLKTDLSPSLFIYDICESAVGFLIQKLKINKCK